MHKTSVRSLTTSFIEQETFYEPLTLETLLFMQINTLIKVVISSIGKCLIVNRLVTVLFCENLTLFFNVHDILKVYTVVRLWMLNFLIAIPILFDVFWKLTKDMKLFCNGYEELVYECNYCYHYWFQRFRFI